MSDDNFQEFLNEFDPDFLRCGEVADQSTTALLRAAERCETDPLCVAYCTWMNLTKLLNQVGWTDTQLIALIYRLTTDKVKDDNEDKP